MNRFNWTYVDINGSPHNVGVMHGAESGNLLIYCDSNIIHIRFKIFDSTSLSFFIEEELCELSIEKQGDNFLYGFTIDREADTPLNRRRKLIDKKHFKQTMMVASVFVAFMVSFIAGLLIANQDDDLQAIRRTETNAKVFLTNYDGGSKFTYQFVANGKPQKVEKNINVHSLISENGMPIEDGDEFMLRYTTSDPKKNIIDYNKPTPQQIIKYHDRAMAKYQALHPFKSVNYCGCVIDLAYDTKGIDGLASVYFQEADYAKNPRHNKNTYQKLMDDPNFKAMLKTKCDY